MLHCSQALHRHGPNQTRSGIELSMGVPPSSYYLSSTSNKSPRKGILSASVWNRKKESRVLGASWHPSKETLIWKCWFFPLLLSQKLPKCTRKSFWTSLCTTAHIQTIPSAIYLTSQMDLKPTLSPPSPCDLWAKSSFSFSWTL